MFNFCNGVVESTSQGLVGRSVGQSPKTDTEHCPQQIWWSDLNRMLECSEMEYIPTTTDWTGKRSHTRCRSWQEEKKSVIHIESFGVRDVFVPKMGRRFSLPFHQDKPVASNTRQ